MAKSPRTAYVAAVVIPLVIAVVFLVPIPGPGAPLVIMTAGLLPSGPGEGGAAPAALRPTVGVPDPAEPGGAGAPEEAHIVAEFDPAEPGGAGIPEDFLLKAESDPEDRPVTAPVDPPPDPVDNRTAARFILEKAKTHKTQSSCADPPSNEIRTSTQINRVVDANTIETGDGRMRLALIGDYKPGLQGFNSAESHLRDQCTSKGRHIVYDADERLSAGPDGLIVAKVWCYGGDVTLGCSINEHLLDSNSVELYVPHCSDSKFGDEDWAKNAGC